MLFIFFHSFSVGAFHLNIKLMSDDEYSSDAKVFGFNEIMAIMRYMIQFETETTIKTLNTLFLFYTVICKLIIVYLTERALSLTQQRYIINRACTRSITESIWSDLFERFIVYVL